MAHWGYAGSKLRLFSKSSTQPKNAIHTYVEWKRRQQSYSATPARWAEAYPFANGKSQSPIDIVGAEYKPYTPFVFDYKDDDITSVENNGHSVTFHATKGNCHLIGGPLTSKYRLAQFHFHWGHEGEHVGSEHTLDGKHFDGEMHFVHWNCDKYASFADSLKHADGLCVLGIFIEMGDCDNAAFKCVIDGIDMVKQVRKKNLTSQISPKSLLPSDVGSYYHYSGSLTTPTLNECVQWIVFNQTIKLNKAQLQHFHAVHDSHSKCIVDNCRPVCPLNGRKITKSFQ